MGFRTDKFSVGDKVQWSPDYERLIRARGMIGDGPFVLVEVIDRDNEPPSDDMDQSLWSSMGHTQHVFVQGHPDRMFSGAYFVLSDEASS